MSKPRADKSPNVVQTSSEDGHTGVTDSPENDDTIYVNGHPVIRNGKHSLFIVIHTCRGFLTNPPVGADVSRYLVSDRDDGDAALTFRSMVLGTAFTALSSVITMLYTFKPTQMQVSAVFIQRKSAPSAFTLLESLKDGNTRHVQFWSTLPARRGRWQHRPQTE